MGYETEEGEVIQVKIAASGSYAQSQKSIARENSGWQLKPVTEAAADSWDKKLASIEVRGGTDKQRAIFYSCLYHAFASPVMTAKKGDQFVGLDGKSHIAEHDRYDLVPYWDTGRNQIVLLTLLEPEVKLNILQSQLDMAKESGWMGTSFHGDHAVAMYLGDWQRGLKFDYASVYPYLFKRDRPKGAEEQSCRIFGKGLDPRHLGGTSKSPL